MDAFVSDKRGFPFCRTRLSRCWLVVFWSQALPIWLRYRVVQWRVDGLPEKEQVRPDIVFLFF